MFGDGGRGAEAANYRSNGCTQNNTSGGCGSADASGDLATIPYGGGTAHLGGGNYTFADDHVKWLKGVEGTWSQSDPGNATAYNGTKCTGIRNGKTKHAYAGGDATFALD